MRILFGFLLVSFSIGSVLADSLDDINGQISSERAKSAQANAQIRSLQNDHDAIKTQHDALQQKYATDANDFNQNCAGRPENYGNCASWRANMLSEQQQIGQEVAELERRAHELESQGQQLANDIEASNVRVQNLLQQQGALQQLKNAAGSSEQAADEISKNPNAIEAAKKDSSCQFDTLKCGKTKAPPDVAIPSAKEVVSEKVAKDPEYQKLNAMRTSAQKTAAKAQDRLDKLTIQQQSESDPAKRQQLQISIYHATNDLKTATSTIRTTEIGIDKVKRRVDGAPDMREAVPTGGETIK
jgi:chromosome segregation ATPase